MTLFAEVLVPPHGQLSAPYNSLFAILHKQTSAECRNAHMDVNVLHHSGGQI